MRRLILSALLIQAAGAAPTHVDVVRHGARVQVSVRSSGKLRVESRPMSGSRRRSFVFSPAELQSTPGTRDGVHVRQLSPHRVEVSVDQGEVRLSRPSAREAWLGFSSPLTGSERTMVTDTFVQADLGRVVQYLAGRMGRRASWEPGIAGVVTVRFQSVPIEEALDTVLRMVDDHYRYRLVGTQELRVERGF